MTIHGGLAMHCGPMTQQSFCQRQEGAHGSSRRKTGAKYAAKIRTYRSCSRQTILIYLYSYIITSHADKTFKEWLLATAPHLPPLY